ncbi:MAG: hypothetical protein ACHP6I_01945 [Rickettsiales bacterium]
MAKISKVIAMNFVAAFVATSAMATNAPAPAMGGAAMMPPAEAVAACKTLTAGAACSFTSMKGDKVSGTCNTAPQQTVIACMPVTAEKK